MAMYGFLGLGPNLERLQREAQAGAFAQSMTVLGVNVVLVAFLLGLLKAE
jgi:hypothetical protein